MLFWSLSKLLYIVEKKLVEKKIGTFRIQNSGLAVDMWWARWEFQQIKLKIYHVCMNAETVPFFPLNKPNSSKGYPSPSGKILLDNWISLFS